MKKIIMLAVICTCTITLISCLPKNNNEKAEIQKQSSASEDTENKDNKKEDLKESSSSEKKYYNENTNSASDKNDDSVTVKNNSANISSKSQPQNDINMEQKVKDYILNGQEDLSYAEKISWSERFLNNTDLKSLYKNYLNEGKKADDVKAFAEYITLNAPILDNWEELFRAEVYDAYEKKIVRIEHVDDEFYSAYIEEDGKEVPFVVVSSRTGNYHG